MASAAHTSGHHSMAGEARCWPKHVIHCLVNLDEEERVGVVVLNLVMWAIYDYYCEYTGTRVSCGPKFMSIYACFVHYTTNLVVVTET